MAQSLSDIDLCEAQSDLFVDNEVDFELIAQVARSFPLAHVEMVLFEWVAPVCYTNTLAPVPPIWTGFERDSLWAEIQCLLAREAKAHQPARLALICSLSLVGILLLRYFILYAGQMTVM
ncbi:DUF7079 family protein [Aeromonas hydrophila]|uniref:DUF7079 domain-containing protein n=1 Tax=Aeromonas hydrophila TaxID=644 RepID=A0AAX3NZG4_AERHY|nr:hypothetical protein [Aeromonas hydrophila]WEE24522.1 hypothetical protein PY771_12570 [Aeromonas hydrophila]